MTSATIMSAKRCLPFPNSPMSFAPEQRRSPARRCFCNLGFGLRLVSQIGAIRHTLLFDTGPEGAIFIRNCSNLGIPMGEIECIAVSHGHWDHMAGLPAALGVIV